MATSYRVRVVYVGIAPHERDERGRLFFPRCERTKSRCYARPTHVAMQLYQQTGITMSARLCRHHAEELKT